MIFDDDENSQTLEEEKETAALFDLRGMKFNSIFEKFNKLSPWLNMKDSYLKKRQKLYYDPSLKF